MVLEEEEENTLGETLSWTTDLVYVMNFRKGEVIGGYIGGIYTWVPRHLFTVIEGTYLVSGKNPTE